MRCIFLNPVIPGSSQYRARDAIIPPSVPSAYETSMREHQFPMMQDDYYRSHDHLAYIGGNRQAAAAAHSMYIPPAMFNMPIPPPQHYGNQPPPPQGAGKSSFSQALLNSQASQDSSSQQPLTQSPLTQNTLTITQPTQPLSQSELSQDLLDDFKSQDMSLSQDLPYTMTTMTTMESGMESGMEATSKRPLLDYGHPLYY
jgi:hypothetical protein